MVARTRHLRRKREANSRYYETNKPSFFDVLWIFVAGGLHYASLIVFVGAPDRIHFAQLPLVPVLIIPGCALMAAGLALLLWSHRAMGLAFSVSAAPTPGCSLVTSGPYAWVRHPIYLALVMKAVGGILATANLVVAAVSVIMLVGIAVRIPFEERKLRESFGAEWDAYASRTPALFPAGPLGPPAE